MNDNDSGGGGMHWYDDAKERDRLSLRERVTTDKQLLSSEKDEELLHRDVATALLEELDMLKRMETLLPRIPSVDLREELQRRGFQMDDPRKQGT